MSTALENAQAARFAHANHWHVIQTLSGQESRVIELIGGLVDPSLVVELFVPYRLVKKAYRGQWRVVREKILPGYVFVVTPDPKRLSGLLYKVPAFTRLLHAGDRFAALSPDEVAFINAFTQPDHRIIDISEGIIEGDRVIVLNGPLMGQTARIAKIDRHKRLAYVEMEMLGRKVLVKMGLEIVRKSGA